MCEHLPLFLLRRIILGRTRENLDPHVDEANQRVPSVFRGPQRGSPTEVQCLVSEANTCCDGNWNLNYSRTLYWTNDNIWMRLVLILAVTHWWTGGTMHALLPPIWVEGEYSMFDLCWSANTYLFSHFRRRIVVLACVHLVSIVMMNDVWKQPPH